VKRPIEPLIDHEDPAWALVQKWIAEAKHPVEIVSPAETAGESLVSMQTTTSVVGPDRLRRRRFAFSTPALSYGFALPS
jgi:hypothetical protein